MTARVLLRRAAELDLVGIEDWYETQQTGLGAEFRGAVDELFRRIGDNPLFYPERTETTAARFLGGFPTSSGTGCTKATRSCSLAFTGDETRGWPVSAFAEGSEPGLQRTVAERPPLSRQPFGGTWLR